jgi:hypothetical protein
MSRDTYRVYIAQVNQDYVEVRASSPDEARDKGYQKWRRDVAHSYVTSVAVLKPTPRKRTSRKRTPRKPVSSDVTPATA